VFKATDNDIYQLAASGSYVLSNVTNGMCLRRLGLSERTRIDNGSGKHPSSSNRAVERRGKQRQPQKSTGHRRDTYWSSRNIGTLTFSKPSVLSAAICTTIWGTISGVLSVDAWGNFRSETSRKSDFVCADRHIAQIACPQRCARCTKVGDLGMCAEARDLGMCAEARDLEMRAPSIDS
jgi:hypothetical protein